MDFDELAEAVPIDSSEPLLLACTYYYYITQHAKKLKETLANVISTVKPVLSGHSKRRPKIVCQDQLSLNAGQKYCRMLHSAILSTFIKLPFVIKIFVLSIFEWLLKKGFTIPKSRVLAHMIIVHG